MLHQRYQYSDLQCEYCIDRGTSCSFRLCKHIMGNLSDLFGDHNFREAVANAEQCRSCHRYTLVYLKKRFAGKGHAHTSGTDEEVVAHCEYKPGCANCNYSGPGFICHSEADETCLKDWANETKNTKER